MIKRALSLLACVLFVCLAALSGVAGAVGYPAEHQSQGFILALSGTETAEISLSRLPPEAVQTLALIKRGGPFPYPKDGSVFGNRERLLPPKPKGYYTEYTVKTPGARDRGARRIVAGGDPQRSGEYYYTADHYRSFLRIRD
jgi:ribonuclease T1